jgi:hypothetical protein
MVFGISTPGPLDKRSNAKKAKIGINEKQTINTVPVSRLGGTQFVMDDGDDRFIREKSAGTGPVKYMDVLAGEKGEPTIPYNEYFRVRTRTGHQILMHNSEDLIYIGNSRGTTWIELTSNGKIDIYASDSISIHTENDLNIKADRDINMEAGRNINLKTERGRLHADVATNLEIVIGTNGLITTRGRLDINTTGATKISSTGALDIKSGGPTKVTAGGDASIGAANIIISGGKIDLNGPAAPVADTAATTKLLVTHENPVSNVAKGWNPAKYQDGKIKSIMKRIPMHEPWVLHENQAPEQLTPKNTDREV